jgi:SAM-dependent methyltransferase
VTGEIRADFDRIALLPAERWDVNSHYHRFLLKQLPAGCACGLDIGCGMGAFTRLLASRCERVLALDLSPQMIQVARARSRGFTNVEFQLADVTTWPLPAGQFDCIASIATLHHLPMDDMLVKLKAALGPGGVLVVLDLYRAASAAELLTGALAMPASMALLLLHTGRLRQPPQVRQAWAEHGRHDSYLTLTRIRGACASILPGARLTKHLLWRYSIVWQKESSSGQASKA